jgi:hypothetical protein
MARQKSFRYRAVKTWNSIDNDLKKLPLKTFKTELTKKMLETTNIVVKFKCFR